VCVLFTPELTICGDTNRPNNLKSLAKDRKYIQCEVCNEIGGACVQCADGECLQACHPYCAYEARRQMVVRVDDLDETVSYELYCSKHKHSARTRKVKNTTIASSRNSLQDDESTKANKTSKNHKKLASRHRIGIADCDPPNKPNNNNTSSRDNINVLIGSAKKSVRFGCSGDDGSPGDLVDTAEKPPRDKKKKRFAIFTVSFNRQI
jgi:hypothetical protein